MDYGKPAAQMMEADVFKLGKPFVGRKITVKGTVTQLKSNSVHLGHGIRCEIHPNLQVQTAIGEEIVIDGFLKRCQEGDILIQPAVSRDPATPFEPMKRLE